MDYKKILKSRKTREKILDFLRFIPDTPMLKLQYKIKTGRKLDLKNPQRYTEKLQWYKLNYKNPLMIQCCDKYDVRGYIKDCGLEDILNKCYGVFDNPNEVDFNKLPKQFVLKDTLGGGGNSIIICSDKTNADLNAYVAQMKSWVNSRTLRSGGREWPYYSGKKHRIIIENYIDGKNGGPADFKFFCFGGKPEFVVYDADRFTDHKRNIYDLNWNNLNIETDCKCCDKIINPPANLSEMITVAEKLSEDFPAVRVDLYSVEGKIYFGELTFYPWSGYVQFNPDEFDFILGDKFKLPSRNEEQ